MQALLHGNITTRTLSLTAEGSGAFSWPELIQGDTLNLSLRFTQEIGDKPRVVDRTCLGLRIALGKRDLRPTGGTIRFQIGNPATTPAEGANLTTALSFNFTAGQLQSALNVLSAKPADAAVTESNGTFTIVWGTETAFTTLTARTNRLAPVAIAEIGQQEVDDEFRTLLRLKQAPAAFVDTFESVLPPAPFITTLRSGGFSGDVEWNEVQKLTVPPHFRGTFTLTRDSGLLKSSPLTVTSNVDAIAAALAEIVDEDGEFLVEEIEGTGAVRIEFAGEMAGTNHDPIGIAIIDNPPGDVTAQLTLDRPELAAYLRSVAANQKLKLPLEIEATLVNEVDEDVEDIVTFSAEVTILPEVTLPELASAAPINWLRPPSPRWYRPRGAGQVASGVHHYSAPKGNGVATEFAIDHNLATDIALPLVRRNVTDGELLKLGTDYRVEYSSNNSLLIVMLGDWVSTPPTTNELLVAVLGMAVASQYDAHTHSIAEIDDLQDTLDALAESLAALQALIPSGALTADETVKDKTTTIQLARFENVLEAFPARAAIQAAAAPVVGDITTKTVTTPAGTTTEQVSTQSAAPVAGVASLADLSAALLPKDGGLLPAVLDAKTGTLSLTGGNVPVPDSSFRGSVYENTSGNTVTLPGGGGRRSTELLAGEFAACDGRYWYRVGRMVSTEPNFYPLDFERELFLMAITPQDLSLKRQLEIGIGLEVAVMSRRGLTLAEYDRTRLKNSQAQWTLLIEWGLFTIEAGAKGESFSLVSTGSDQINTTLGADDGTPVKLSNTSGGLPAPLVAGTTYYLRDKSGSNYKLAATLGGPAIDITTNGSGNHTITPQTAHSNLKAIDWHATPLLEHTFHFGRTPISRSYQARIKRAMVSAVDTITAEQVIQGNSSAAGSAPSQARFALRGRLCRFDTTDAITDPRSLVCLRGLNVQVLTGDADRNGLALIRTL